MDTQTNLTIDAFDDVDLPGVADHVSRIAYRSGLDGRADWAYVRPGVSGDTWIVCIHGHGSHADQLYTRPDIRDHWLPRFMATGFGLLTPNLRDNGWMGPAAAADLHGLLEYVRRRYGGRRFILASGSMGGTSNCAYAALHPEDAAGVIGLGVASDLTSYYRWCRERNAGVIKEIADAIESAYGGPPDAAGDVYSHHSALRHADRLTMPVYLCHGDADGVIPVEQSRKLAKALAGRPSFRYEELPGGQHDSPLWNMGQALDWVTRRIQ